MDRFQLFRLSLLARFQPDLLGEYNLTRQEYLRKVFGNREFTHYGTPFHFVVERYLESESVILGRIGRETVSAENTPPEEGLTEMLRPAWKASVIAIDIREDRNGQKLAVEFDVKVGRPKSILKSFIDSINVQNDHGPFILKFAPIFEAESFWAFAKENRGNIVRLTFELITPNGLWTATSDLKDELADAKRILNAEKVTSTFSSSQGLNTDNESIKVAVKYAESGSGVIRAKTRENTHFNSTTKPKFVMIPSVGGSDNMVERASIFIRRILGRE